MEENGSDFFLNKAKGDEAQENLVERIIGNGDLYVGFCSGSRSEGMGRFASSDQRPCQGLWSEGKSSETGNIPWPSGAIYVGYIHGSSIHGYGCYIDCNGESYEGQWVMNQKHVCGRKRYGNGDVYEGWWRNGDLQGHDRYFGHLRKEVMWGEGILLWASSYEYWRRLVNEVSQNSCEVLNFVDGGILCGRWNKGEIVRNCRYFPVRVSFEWLKSHVRTGIFTTDDGRKMELISGGHRSLCSEYLDTFLVNIHSQLESTAWISEKYSVLQAEFSIPQHANDVLSKLSVFQGRPLNEQKISGEVICKSHKKHDLLHVLQLGIRCFLLKNMAMPEKEPSTLDFKCTTKTHIQFPSDSGHLPNDFKWEDYCPLVFRHLQELDKIDTIDYMLSICGNETLRELTSPGKSGSLLYLSNNDRFVIKTMRKCEVKVLLDMLPNYYQHVVRYRNTLLTKFYGLHAVKDFRGHKVHFIVMGNIFCSDLQIHKRFDLKGSSQGRCVSKVEVDESTTFKDLDLNYTFFIDPSIRNQLLTQIKHDCDFLEAEGIMDYSLLLGLHMRSTPPLGSSARGSFNERVLTSTTSFPVNSSRRRGDDLQLRCAEGSFHKLGAKLPAHAVQTQTYSGGSVSCRRRVASKEDYNVLVNIGIIDILQNYNMKKRIEHVYKSLQFDPESISAINPKAYSTRFQDFLSNVFPAKGLDGYS